VERRYDSGITMLSLTWSGRGWKGGDRRGRCNDNREVNDRVAGGSVENNVTRRYWLLRRSAATAVE